MRSIIRVCDGVYTDLNITPLFILEMIIFIPIGIVIGVYVACLLFGVDFSLVVKLAKLVFDLVVGLLKCQRL